MNVVMKTNEVQVHANGSTAKEKTIAFTFNPDEVEMVRAKDGAYIIRERRTRSVATFPKAEQETVQSS